MDEELQRVDFCSGMWKSEMSCCMKKTIAVLTISEDTMSEMGTICERLMNQVKKPSTPASTASPTVFSSNRRYHASRCWKEKRGGREKNEGA